ncbi:hypothetical protein KSP40_PGU004059 [Platanthera guangdongensis]|uniref:Uncharacterized protein n=1 Tax=Platanthera guangdongensis TaxID=2320717 RepID=A0ABR2N2R5_9ASPA
MSWRFLPKTFMSSDFYTVHKSSLQEITISATGPSTVPQVCVEKDLPLAASVEGGRDAENPDLWKWLSGQEQPPDTVSNNPVFVSIQSGVIGNLKAHASPATRTDPGHPWLTGWDDKKVLGSGPKYGNQ